LDEVWNEAFLAENKIILANETEQVPPSRRAKFLGRSGIEAKKILSSDLMRDLVENAARTVGKRFADAVLELLRKKK
jgi:hypothetical protein